MIKLATAYHDKVTTIAHQADNTITIVQDENSIKDTQQIVVLTREQWQAIVSEVTRSYMLKDEYHV